MNHIHGRFTISRILTLSLLVEWSVAAPTCLAQSPLELLKEKVPDGERLSYGAKQLLTFHYGKGNNFAYFEFVPVDEK
jgi:hypothetical protein